MTLMAPSRSRSQTVPGQLELFPPSRYLTIDEVAELMHVPKSFIYRRTCRGHDDPIPSFRFGGHLRFRLDEIEDWIANHRVLHEEDPGIFEAPVRRAVAATRGARQTTTRRQRAAKNVKSRTVIDSVTGRA